MLPLAVGRTGAGDQFGGAGGVAHEEPVTPAVNVQVELLAAAAGAFGQNAHVTGLRAHHFHPGFQGEVGAAGKVEVGHHHAAVDGRTHADRRVRVERRIPRLTEGDVEVLRVVPAQGILRPSARAFIQPPIAHRRVGQHGLRVARRGRGLNRQRHRGRGDRAKSVGDHHAILARVGQRHRADLVARAGRAGDRVGVIEQPLESQRRAPAGGRDEVRLGARVTRLGPGRGGDDRRAGDLNAQVDHRAGNRAVPVGDHHVIGAGIGDRQGVRHPIRGGGAGDRGAVLAPLIGDRTGAHGRHKQAGVVPRVKRARRGLRLGRDEWRHVGRFVDPRDLRRRQGFAEHRHLVDPAVEIPLGAVALRPDGPIDVVDRHRAHRVGLGRHQRAVAVEIPLRAIVSPRQEHPVTDIFPGNGVARGVVAAIVGERLVRPAIQAQAHFGRRAVTVDNNILEAGAGSGVRIHPGQQSDLAGEV